MLAAMLFAWALRDTSGWTLDLPLATLLVFALLGSTFETLFLSGLTAWLMNWTYAPRLEILLLVALPALVLLARRTALPWKNMFSAYTLAAAGVGIFYVISSFSYIPSRVPVFLTTIIVSGFWGMAVYFLEEMFLTKAPRA